MDYIKIYKGNECLYGGNQSYFEGKTMQGYGCGLIAAADVTLYLSDYPKEISWEQYLQYIRKVRKLFPVLPHLGMNGWMISFGMNHLLRKLHLPYRCHWKLRPIGEHSKREMEEMLQEEIPVILAIGPNFPNVLGKQKVAFHRNGIQDHKKANTTAHKHFVVITAIEGEDLTLSSWGKTYHMRWEEYQQYARKHSAFFFTNYLQIKKI